MSDINEIIGRALFENSPDFNSTDEQAAAVVKALGEAGYVLTDAKDPAAAIMAMFLAVPEVGRSDVIDKIRYNNIFCMNCGTGSIERPNRHCQCDNDE